MIGRTLSHYRICDKLGAGGMGEVFLAEDTRLKRKVALKVLPAELAASPERLARFQREAEAVAALSHPSIVTIHSVEESEGIRFLTMELVEGQGLDRAIPPGGMPLSRLLSIGAALADALAAAHGRGVIHRDLKPANVMLTPEGRVKILDFGLAKLAAPEAAGAEYATAIATATREGVVLGTVPYMSPEQLQGKPVDVRTDLFALGVLLYELAAGERPYAGDSAAEVASAILRDTPKPLSECRGDLPRQLARIVDHLLEKDPERRFQTAKDVRNELERLQEETRTTAPGGAPPPPAVDLSSPGLRPRRLPLLLGAVGVVLLAGVAYLLRPPDGAPTAASAAGEIRTLAVLPLENLSGDPEEEYFAQGMTDALIAELGKVSAVAVVPRMTSMLYRDTSKTLTEIASELGADALVEGSVQQAEGKVRIRVELIGARGASRLWNETYDSELRDVFVLQSRIAREITGQIKVSLAPLEGARLHEARSTDPEALRQYLKGRYYTELFSEEAFDRAIDAFERAIAREPGWAMPRAGLATAYSYRLFTGYGDPDVDWKAAAANAEKALELDPGLEEALSLQGAIKLFHEWDWSGAREQIEAARRRNPRAAQVLDNYSSLLLVTGKLEEGIAEHRSALAANPLSHDLSCSLVRKYYAAGRYDAAIEFGRSTVDDFPSCPFEHLGTAEALIQKGRYDEAIAHLEASLAIAVTDRALGRLGAAYWLAGRKTEARGVLARLQGMENADPYHVAPLHVAMGDREAALEALEQAYRRRSVMLPFLNIEPAFAEIRDDPRFVGLVRRMGLPSG